jgi:hypothetical protein
MLCGGMAGCASEFNEELIGQYPVEGHAIGRPLVSDNAPSWVLRDPQQTGDEVYFVGRGVSFNVIDEAAAVRAAREDILAQFSQLISTRVTTSARQGDLRHDGEASFSQKHMPVQAAWSDDTYGIRTLPGPELRQFIEREAAQFTSGIAGDLIDRGVYFEKWDMREEPAGSLGRPSRGMIRYKCWALMSIPKATLQQRVEEFRGLVRDAYARFQEDRKNMLRIAEENRKRALAWAEEDRQIRIRREDEDRQWNHEMIMGDRREAENLRHHIAKSRLGTLYRVSATH